MTYSTCILRRDILQSMISFSTNTKLIADSDGAVFDTLFKVKSFISTFIYLYLNDCVCFVIRNNIVLYDIHVFQLSWFPQRTTEVLKIKLC
jgi:hypothetical protein